MFFSQNTFVVCLGIVMSIVLFTQGEKVNLETTLYGELVEQCQALRLEYANCVVRRDKNIREQYGASAEELEARKERQMSWLIIPGVVLITTIFIGFSASRNEKYLVLIALTPLFLSFLRYYPYAPEKWMIPFYLFFAAFLANIIAFVKRQMRFS